MRRSYVMGGVAVIAVVLVAAIFGVLSDNQDDNTVDTSSINDEIPKDLGLTYLANGEYAQARDYYSEQIGKEPEKAEWYFQRGQAFVGLEDYEAALNDFTQAINLDEQYAEAYAARADVHFRQDNFNNARDDAEQAIALNNNVALAHFILGNFYVSQNEILLALHEYDSALTIDSTYVDAYIQRGDIFTRERRFDKALTDYSKAIELDANLANAYAKRAQVYLALGNYEDADADVEKALTADEQEDLAYAVRGAIRLNAQQNNAALLDFNQAIQINSNNVLALAYRGYYLGLNNNHDASEADFNQAILLQEDFALTYFLRGILQTDYSLANQNFALATENAPTWDLAHYYLAQGYENLAQSDLAIDSYTRAINANPNFVGAYLRRADIYREKQSYDDAISDYTRVIELNSNIASAYRGRSLAYAAQGNFQDAHTDRVSVADLNYDRATIMVGEYDIEVTKVWTDNKLEGIDPGRGNFLVVEMTLYNYSEDDLCLLKRNFKAQFGDVETEPSRMYQVVKEHNLDRQYPPTESRDKICVPDSRYWNTFVSFDVPSNLDAVTIDFNVSDNRTTFELWLLEDIETKETLSNGAIAYNFVLAEIDGEAKIEIGEPVILETEVERVSDVDIITIDNCFGTGTITQGKEVSHIHTRETRIENSTTREYGVAFDPRLEIEPQIGSPIAKVSSKVSVEFMEAWATYTTQEVTSQAEATTIEDTTTVTLEIEAGKIGQAEVIWIIVAKEGKVDITINGQTETLLFSVDNDLKAVTRALPSEECTTE